jgi:hypothetical protein
MGGTDGDHDPEINPYTVPENYTVVESDERNVKTPFLLGSLSWYASATTV